MCQKLVLATPSEALSFGNTWGGRLSHARPSSVIEVGVAPDCLARLSHEMRRVYTESFGLVAPLRLAGLLVPVVPNGMAQLG
jgi:hypothetical protein